MKQEHFNQYLEGICKQAKAISSASKKIKTHDDVFNVGHKIAFLSYTHQAFLKELETKEN